MYTISDIMRINRENGYYFFTPDTMRFFDSIVYGRVHQGPGGVYFVTSERPPHGSRQYSVRRFRPEKGNITNMARDVGGLAAAHKLAAHYATHGAPERQVSDY